MGECVILVGLQGAGKTSLYRARFSETHEHVSKDNFSRAKDKAARQLALVEAALAGGRSVVVDNTNPTAADRAAVIACARRHGARVIGYFFDVSTREAVARNRRREGRARVPDVAIFTTAKRMVPPTADEGFDELYRVTLATEGEFHVAQL